MDDSVIDQTNKSPPPHDETNSNEPAKNIELVQANSSSTSATFSAGQQLHVHMNSKPPSQQSNSTNNMEDDSNSNSTTHDEGNNSHSQLLAKDGTTPAVATATHAQKSPVNDTDEPILVEADAPSPNTTANNPQTMPSFYSTNMHNQDLYLQQQNRYSAGVQLPATSYYASQPYFNAMQHNQQIQPTGYPSQPYMAQQDAARQYHSQHPQFAYSPQFNYAPYPYGYPGFVQQSPFAQYPPNIDVDTRGFSHPAFVDPTTGMVPQGYSSQFYASPSSNVVQQQVPQIQHNQRQLKSRMPESMQTLSSRSNLKEVVLKNRSPLNYFRNFTLAKDANTNTTMKTTAESVPQAQYAQNVHLSLSASQETETREQRQLQEQQQQQWAHQFGYHQQEETSSRQRNFSQVSSQSTKANNLVQKQHHQGINGIKESNPASLSTTGDSAKDHAISLQELNLVCEICLLCAPKVLSPSSPGSTFDSVKKCRKCGGQAHSSCYGGFASKHQSDVWFCEACLVGVTSPACVLCPNLGGLLKASTVPGWWVHSVCAQAIAEATIFQDETQLASQFPISLHSISPSKWCNDVCALCYDIDDASSGVCITCSHSKCKVAVHGSCAHALGLTLAKSNFLFCPRHTNQPRKKSLAQAYALCSRQSVSESNASPFLSKAELATYLEQRDALFLAQKAWQLNHNRLQKASLDHAEKVNSFMVERSERRYEVGLRSFSSFMPTLTHDFLEKFLSYRERRISLKLKLRFQQHRINCLEEEISSKHKEASSLKMKAYRQKKMEGDLSSVLNTFNKIFLKLGMTSSFTNVQLIKLIEEMGEAKGNEGIDSSSQPNQEFALGVSDDEDEDVAIETEKEKEAEEMGDGNDEVTVSISTSQPALVNSAKSTAGPSLSTTAMDTTMGKEESKSIVENADDLLQEVAYWTRLPVHVGGCKGFSAPLNGTYFALSSQEAARLGRHASDSRVIYHKPRVSLKNALRMQQGVRAETCDSDMKNSKIDGKCDWEEEGVEGEREEEDMKIRRSGKKMEKTKKSKKGGKRKPLKNAMMDSITSHLPQQLQFERHHQLRHVDNGNMSSRSANLLMASPDEYVEAPDLFMFYLDEEECWNISTIPYSKHVYAYVHEKSALPWVLSPTNFWLSLHRDNSVNVNKSMTVTAYAMPSKQELMLERQKMWSMGAQGGARFGTFNTDFAKPVMLVETENGVLQEVERATKARIRSEKRNHEWEVDGSAQLQAKRKKVAKGGAAYEKKKHKGKKCKSGMPRSKGDNSNDPMSFVPKVPTPFG
eukprot:m.40494 g.40494  ORF g.40494 m.40494 type:complete len:1280 (-) comp6931_c0_seq1:1823-5662(-)